MTKAIWKNHPEAQDFPAAAAYLGLLFTPARAAALVKALKKAKVGEHAAKDIFRASRLPLLASDDPHVAADLKKIVKEKKLSPVLLVRGDGAAGVPLLIADGYHRICAAYHHNYDEKIPCVIVDRPKG